VFGGVIELVVTAASEAVAAAAGRLICALAKPVLFVVELTFKNRLPARRSETVAAFRVKRPDSVSKPLVLKV